MVQIKIIDTQKSITKQINYPHPKIGYIDVVRQLHPRVLNSELVYEVDWHVPAAQNIALSPGATVSVQNGIEFNVALPHGINNVRNVCEHYIVRYDESKTIYNIKSALSKLGLVNVDLILEMKKYNNKDNLALISFTEYSGTDQSTLKKGIDDEVGENNTHVLKL